MTSSTTSGLVPADPEGDVNLLIGIEDDVKSLRVSSKVLILASPVFKGVFSPNFSEGSDLLNATTSCEIKLPEDDTEAMTVICYALHHRRITPHDLHFELLEKVAFLCDKYDLADVLTPWSGLWLQRWEFEGKGFEHWSKMMCISCVFANQRMFYLSTENLLRSCVIPSPRLKHDSKHDSLNKKTLGSRVLLDPRSEDWVSSIHKMGIFSITNIPERLFSKSYIEIR